MTGTGTVPRQASQACRREALGSLVLIQVSTPKSTVREVPSGSSIQPYPSSRAASRATLDHPEGSQRKLRARRCCSLTSQPIKQAQRSVTLPRPATLGLSWPALCRPSQSERRGASDKRDHRDEPGDDGQGVSDSPAIRTSGIAGIGPVATCRVPFPTIPIEPALRHTASESPGQ